MSTILCTKLPWKRVSHKATLTEHCLIYIRRNSTTPGHINTVALTMLLQAVQTVTMASARWNLVLPPMIKTTVNKFSIMLKNQRTDYQQKTPEATTVISIYFTTGWNVTVIGLIRKRHIIYLMGG